MFAPPIQPMQPNTMFESKDKSPLITHANPYFYSLLNNPNGESLKGDKATASD